MSYWYQLVFSVSFFCFVLKATGQQLQPYQPTPAEIAERYKASTNRDGVAKNTIFKTSVQARWIRKGTAFWYANRLKDSMMEYLLVHAASGKKSPLFIVEKLAAELSKATGTTIDPRRLFLEGLSLNEAGTLGSFGFNKKFFQYEISKNKLYTIEALPKNELPDRRRFNRRRSFWENYQTGSLSPDKKYTAYIKNHNVFIQPVGDSAAAIQYTQNGSEGHPYGSLAWSPDSKNLVGYHIRPVVDSNNYHIVTSVPGTTRGQLKSYAYKQPGDPFTTYEMFVFSVPKRNSIKVNTPIRDFYDAPYLFWTKDRTHFYYEKIDRGHQRYRLIEVNVANGQTRNILDEQTKTFIYDDRIFTQYLAETSEFIHTSEENGWQHIYLIDAVNGKQKNQITIGNYVVKNVDSIDAVKRQIWFSARGVNEGEDVYHTHYFRIDFDGKNLVDLTPELADHSISFSPDKKYYLDTYSTLNTAPQTVLRLTATGKKIADIERADISAYLSVVKRLPTRFVAKGRDGTTDIYGAVFLPTEFDSSMRYPIVENIYAGPQDSYVPVGFMPYRGEMQSLADLGFIVVQIDGMGTANRSKAFHDVCWQNLADAGFPDRILWMKALAAKYPFADTTRVGLYGTSAGGQNALGALLFHPEWYKAAVASCGCHDNRVDKQCWNEQWMGYPMGPWYAEQSNVTHAAKLKGALLLMVGEEDDNVPPESTYRVADALIKANKTFEFLPLPGMKHTNGGAYGEMRRKDFFVRHLFKAQPIDRNAL